MDQGTTMKGIISAICFVVFSLATTSSFANECWAVSNMKGYAAYADQGYKFSPDGLPSTLMVCFAANGGTVTGTDVPLVKFGMSTLAGYGGNGQGNELFEVYQLDREKRKLLYVKTRIGTKTMAPIFSDVVFSFVGDAVLISK
jgi:hypothetical protein